MHELLLNSLPGAVEILCDFNTTDVCETKCENLMSSSLNGEIKETSFSQLHCQCRGCMCSQFIKEWIHADIAIYQGHISWRDFEDVFVSPLNLILAKNGQFLKSSLFI